VWTKILFSKNIYFLFSGKEKEKEKEKNYFLYFLSKSSNLSGFFLLACLISILSTNLISLPGLHIISSAGKLKPE
jgi:hypothetical protein